MIDTAWPLASGPLARSLPVRPLFARGGVVVDVDDGVVVDLREQLIRVRGASSATVLAKLIPLMDGHRTIAELERALPDTPAGHLHRIIATLVQHGLVEESAFDEGARTTEAFHQLYRFLYRFAPNRGPDGVDAFHRLRAVVIGILEGAHPEVAARLGDMLAASGAGRVQQITAVSLSDWLASAAPESVLISIAVDGEHYEESCRVDELARAPGLPWLRAVLDVPRGRIDVGPFFHPSSSACYRCFDGLHGQREDGEHKYGRPSADEIGALIGLVATEIVCLIGQLGTSIGDQSVRRVDLRDLRSTELRCVALPCCSRCRPMSAPLSACGPMEPAQRSALVFEGTVGTQSARDRDARAGHEPTHEDLYLPTPSKELAALPQCALPSNLPTLTRSTAASLDSVGAGDKSLDVAHLAAILRFSVGIRNDGPEGVKRWSATSGNLGSPEAFLLVRNVRGLEPGVYFYQPAEHALARLERRSGSPGIEEVLAQLSYDGATPRADAQIMLTGAFHRLARKYGPFGYRLLHFDAGVASSQMQAVATNFGLQARPSDHWFDDVADLALGLEPFEEQATTAIVLGADAGTRIPLTVTRRSQLARRGPQSVHQPSAHAGLTPYQLLQMLVFHSRQHVAEGSAELPPALLCRDWDEGAAPLLQLPSPRHLAMPLGEVLERRRSVRCFSTKAVDAEELSSILRHAEECDVRDWPIDVEVGLTLTFTVLARDVLGVDPGVYCYVPSRRSLERQRPALSSAEVADLLVQREPSSAPALVWIDGNLGACTGPSGARRYRRLLVRAGAAANRLSVASIASGLSGVILAGIVSNPVRQKLGFDGWRRAPLIAFACGYEPGETATSLCL